MNPSISASPGVRTKYLRARDGTTLILNYRPEEASSLRAAVQRIRLQGNRQPSLSLVARRSMSLYLSLLSSGPSALANEVEALEKLATPASRRIKVPRLIDGMAA